MASEGTVVEKRANLLVSRVHWGNVEHSLDNKSQDSIRAWLTATISEEEDAKREGATEQAVPLRRNPSGEDDLALGVEASLYGRQGVKPAQESLRSTRSRPGVSRLNSFNSSVSGLSGSLSVMDVLNMWKDDPEEVLLDLGFGHDVPDLSGRIPARFINQPSQARGINLQVFLQAQQNRLDLENPDVSNRFRQLEVLQQVTTAFSSLAGASPSGTSDRTKPSAAPGKAPAGSDAQERRRRMGLLLRRASKMSFAHDPGGMPAEGDPAAGPKRASRPGVQEGAGLTPLAEERALRGPTGDQECHTLTRPQSALPVQDGTSWLEPLKEDRPLEMSAGSQRKRSCGKAGESFEMEEVYSFDEGSAAGSNTGGAETIVWGVKRTNSTQSDSSGFLEEPFIPSLNRQGQPEMIKTLSGMSGGSTESQLTMREASPPSSPSSLTSPSPLPNLSLPPTLVPPYPGSEAGLPASSSTPVGPSPASAAASPPCLPISDSESPIRSPATPSETRWAAVAFRPSLSTCLLSPVLEENTSASSPLPTLPPPSSSDSHGPVILQAACPQVDCPLSAALTNARHRENGESESSPPPHLSPLELHGRNVGRAQMQNGAEKPPPASSRHPTTDVKRKTNSDKLEEGPEKAHSVVAARKYPRIPSTSGYDAKMAHDVKRAPIPTENSVSLENSLCGDFSGPCRQDSPVLNVITSETDDLAESSECSTPREGGGEGRSCQEEQNILGDVQTTEAGLHSTETQRSPISPAGSRTLSQALHGDIKHQQSRSLPQIQETDIDKIEIATPQADSRKLHQIVETDIDEVDSRTLSEVLAGERKHSDMKQSRRFHQIVETDIDETEIKPYKRHFGLSMDKVLDPGSGAELALKAPGPIAIESLDEVFETTVDGSQCGSEYGDVDAICLELDSDGFVYWAEPVQASSPSPAPGESGSCEALEGPLPSPTGRNDFDLSASTDQAMHFLSAASETLHSPRTAETAQNQNATATDNSVAQLISLSTATASLPANHRPSQAFRSSRSVSVQMPSFLSSRTMSHVVKRRDIPSVDGIPKADTLSSSLPSLDTSMPLQAIQSWTDLQLQQKSKNNTWGGPQASLRPRTLQLVSSERSHSPATVFSSDPTFVTASNGHLSTDSLTGLTSIFQSNSVSLDTGLWPEEDDGNKVEKDEDEAEGSLLNSAACCCSCDKHHTCTQVHLDRRHSGQRFPYSLNELEGMMRCLQQFRLVLADIEEQVSKDQETVFSALSDADRVDVCDITELRRAVKQEAGQLELQLNKLVHHYDDSFKMKLHRLQDEQSLLCSQLRLLPPYVAPPMPESPIPSRSVSTQCCLPPWFPPATGPPGDITTPLNGGEVESPPLQHSLPTSEVLDVGGPRPHSSTKKPDKLDIVGFLQRLKESLRPSENSDSLE